MADGDTMTGRTIPADRPLADERLAVAVQRGLITRETAEAIEAIDVDAVGPASRLTPLVAEAVGFVGAALAVVAAILIVSEFWADLRPWARVSLPALAAAALFGAGAWVRVRDSAAVARLASFLWLLSAASFAFAVGLLGSDVLDLRESRVALLVGGATAVYAGALWAVRRRALQQVAMLAGVVVAAVAGLDVVDVSLADYAGFLVWALGVAWLLLAWGAVVEPRGTAYALGGLLALVGPFAASFSVMRTGLVLGLVTAVALVGASVVERRGVLLWLGIAGLFVHIPRLVFELFGQTLGAPLALFVSGVLLVGVAIGVARIRPADRRTDQ